ncbi:polysaccharide ABC transporter ATP-binding protein [Gilvibacter sp.]|uniref:ABC transporter ATP-binding protein n=1 Tax=Gilvibacter sp. TaxID=2729997 RepID=UPI003B520883
MEEKEVLVKVEGVSKKFSKDLKTGLKYGLCDLFTNAFGTSRSDQLRPKEFWAVQDISFELRRGECLGLIGHNGAGKSTLLKMLNGLIRPDTGGITMKGRVGALIELGAGFNPILTGRENIYNNGAVLGFSKKEIDKKLDTIIEFAELAEFIDMPVQHYSSGMKVRLGFAVAAQMEPDVLLIDEVLAVGDISFRAKCYERINELLESCCVIFVSHAMPQISKICSSTILLNKGTITIQGDPGLVIEHYYGVTGSKVKRYDLISDACQLVEFSMSKSVISNLEKNIVFDLSVFSELNTGAVDVSLSVLSRELVPVFQASSKILNQNIELKKGKNDISFEATSLNINTGKYYISITIEGIGNSKIFLWVHNVHMFEVTGNYVGISPALLNGQWKLG